MPQVTQRSNNQHNRSFGHSDTMPRQPWVSCKHLKHQEWQVHCGCFSIATCYDHKLVDVVESASGRCELPVMRANGQGTRPHKIFLRSAIPAGVDQLLLAISCVSAFRKCSVFVEGGLSLLIARVHVVSRRTKHVTSWVRTYESNVIILSYCTRVMVGKRKIYQIEVEMPTTRKGGLIWK